MITVDDLERAEIEARAEVGRLVKERLRPDLSKAKKRAETSRMLLAKAKAAGRAEGLALALRIIEQTT